MKKIKINIKRAELTDIIARLTAFDVEEFGTDDKGVMMRELYVRAIKKFFNKLGGVDKEVKITLSAGEAIAMRFTLQQMMLALPTFQRLWLDDCYQQIDTAI